MNDTWISPHKPALVLAPMEGVTDAPMRGLMSQLGGFSYCVSEFLRITREVPPARTFFHHLPELATGCRTQSGTPIQLQLLGGNAEPMAKSASFAVELGVKAIDINFGCPAPTVNRHDGGATLLKYPGRIEEIVRSIRKAVPCQIPVSAKLRLGWENPEDIYKNAHAAEQGGASWITIHARTKTQGYKPPVFWKYIGEVRRQINIPVVANGDIWTREDFLRCKDLTGCQHFMVGRGVLSDPSLVAAVAKELGLPSRAQATAKPNNSWPELILQLIHYSELYPKKNPNNIVGRVKQWLRIAHSRYPFIHFDELKRATAVDEILFLLERVPGPYFSPQDSLLSVLNW